MALNDSDVAWTIIFVAVLVAIYLEPTSTVRVQEFKCEGETDSGQCKGKLTKVGRLKFIVNTHSGGVARLVLDGQDNWWAGEVYSRCAVVNAGNWQCSAESGEQLQMIDGQYSRRGSWHHISGLAGWRHWLSYVGIPTRPSWSNP